MPPPPIDPIDPIDPIAAARWQQRRLPHSPWLHEEVARRMEQRLDWITLQPQRWLHWDAAKGGLHTHAVLKQRYPQAQSMELDATTQQAQWPAPGSIDMLWANMALHSVVDAPALLARWQRCLSPQGFVMFSALGPRSLPELRGLYRQRGWPAPSHAYTDMHDWGDRLLQAGFADPVIDTEMITLTFATPQRLLQELRELGRNLSPARATATRARQWLAQWLAAVQTLAQPDGSIPLGLEIIYGHAVQAPQGTDDTGATTIDISHMRRMLRSRI